MDNQAPTLKHITGSFTEGNPIGWTLIVLEHLGVEVPVALPFAYAPNEENHFRQAERLLRAAADLVADAAAKFPKS